MPIVTLLRSVIDASGLSRRKAFAAIREGRVSVAGVVFNRIGGERHAAVIAEACALHVPEVRILGFLPRAEALRLPERHLGLIQAREHPALEAFLDQAAALVAEHVDIAALVGLAQAFAIMPGISRSGATIAAALARGITREDAARFSFLLSTPVVFGAGLLGLMDLAQVGGLASNAGALLVGFASAAVTGYLCIRWLLDFLKRRPLYVFSAYCALFGLFCLVVAVLR